MTNQSFLPECMYKVNPGMHMNALKTFHENNVAVVGRVLRLNSKGQFLEVDLGGGIIGYLPCSQATIYQKYKQNGVLNPSVYTLVGETIQAKILSLDLEKNIIVLSRKENMLEAIKVLRHQTQIKFASIIGFSKLSAFVDIGAGVTARCYGRNLSNNLFIHAKDIGLKTHDIFPVDVLEFFEETNQFEVSRTSTFPDINYILFENDVVVCRVFGKVGDEEGIGYFVSIDNKYCGIVDSPEVELNYGDNISAIISKMTPKGPRLNFIKKI